MLRSGVGMHRWRARPSPVAPAACESLPDPFCRVPADRTLTDGYGSPDERPSDRCDSAGLLARLLDSRLDDDDREAVIEALIELEDPRIVAELESALLDREQPELVRASALLTLEQIPRNDPPTADIHSWSGSDDPWICAYGLGHCVAVDEAQLLAGLQNASATVRTAALEATISIARTRPLVQAVERALADPAPEVREMACRVALFDEPYPLLRGLIRLLDDRELAVRWAAYDALADYPSVAALLALAEPRGPAEDRPPWTATREALLTSLSSALATVPEHGHERLEHWLRPVAWLLDKAPRVTRQSTANERAAEPAPERAPLDLALALRELSSPDTHPDRLRQHLLQSDWSAVGETGVRLATECAGSDDWLVRYGSIDPLRDLACVSELVSLSHDVEPVIARRALARLARLESDGGLAAARDILCDERARSVAGDDALAYVARFAPRDEAEQSLIAELSRPDDRDGLFLSAAHGARRLELRAAVPALLALVNAPVVGSVAVHAAGLEALRSLKHPRAWIDLTHLEDLDHLVIQYELAAWAHPGGRFG